MKQQKKINCKPVSIMVLSFCFVYSQSLAQPANANFRNITSADGLPTTSVTDITQDAFGFIWIGSWDGVFRYDGHRFKKIPATTDGRYIKADKNGGVWISMEFTAGYYDPYTDSLSVFDIPTKNRFSDISIDNKAEVWFTSSDGILKLDAKTKLIKKDPGQQTGGTWGLTAGGDGELLFIYRNDSNNQTYIGHRNSSGIYAYEPFPVDENNPEKGKPFIQRADKQTVNIDSWPAYVYKTGSGGLLLINKYGWANKNSKDTNWVFKKPIKGNISLAAEDAKLDLRGNIWLIQENSLTKIDVNTLERTSYKNDPANPNSILALNQTLAGSRMFFDRQGVLWIAAFSKGISRLNLYESDFGLLKDSTGMPVQDVLSALESKDGSYWIGARKRINGLVHYSAHGVIIKQYGSNSFDAPTGKTVSKELSHPFAWSLAETKDGSVWVGGGSPGPGRGGISRIRPGTDQITRFKSDPSDSLSLNGDWVFKILADGSGRVWTFAQGLTLIEPATEKINRGIRLEFWDKQRKLTFAPALLTSAGNILFQDNVNYKYYLIDHKTLSINPFAEKISKSDSIVFVHHDDSGRIWFVSPKGFGYLDTTYSAIAKLFRFDKLNFPVNEMPIMFNSDKKGNIWIGIDKGIIEFDPVTEKFKHFGFERGLQGNRFEFVNYKGPSGKLYFGGNGGINIFDPAAIKTNPYPPQMLFTDLKLDGQSIKFGEKSAIQKPIWVADKITVGPNVSVISIDFAAIHFASSKGNLYQYKLDGFDKNWRDGGSIGNANYTNLSPGTYTLFIKGSNWDGVWSDGKKSITIKILPPWWQTWWAYTLYGLLFMLLLWEFIKYQKAKTIRKERERTQQRELEQAKEIEKAYTELKSTQVQLIQSEKMASLGELTAGIAHEIQNPLNFVNNFSEVSSELIKEMVDEVDKGNTNEVRSIANDLVQNLEKINHHGKRADAIVKGMLQHSRSSSGIKEPTDINALADEYLRLAYHGLRAKDKSFNANMKTDFDESIGNISIIPQDIGRVILNLITNAFYVVDEKRKSGVEHYEPTVSVSTKKIADKILISVRDNGNGIPQKVLDKIFQPFFTTKPTGQGTGLGLSLSYDIIKAHGGEIKVNTKENHGTEFTIMLPA